MKDRAPIAVIVLGAIALVAVVTWWLPRDADPAAAVVPELEAGSVADATVEAHPTPEPALPVAGDVRAPLEEADDGLGAEDLWAHISDPRNSDLPPRVFASLAKLGAEIVRADATGVGRGRWPHYWATDARAEPCCRELTVHASGAAKDPVSPGLVRVTVAWSGKGLGAADEARVSTIVLRRGATGWQPVRE